MKWILEYKDVPLLHSCPGWLFQTPLLLDPLDVLPLLLPVLKISVVAPTTPDVALSCIVDLLPAPPSLSCPIAAVAVASARTRFEAVPQGP
jgi:hypothetical protein